MCAVLALLDRKRVVGLIPSFSQNVLQNAHMVNYAMYARPVACGYFGRSLAPIREADEI